MICSRCNKEVADGSKFCKFCGNNLVSLNNNHFDFNDSSNWAVICLNLAKNLEKIRNEWFGQCVGILEYISKDKERDIEIKNRKLENECESALKAYQLFIITGILHYYIKPEKGKDFGDLLFAYVCGKELEDCLKYFDRYYEVENDGGTQLFRFSSDVAKYITGNESPLVEGVALGSSFTPFYLMTQLATVEAFRDEDKIEKISKSLNEYFEKNNKS